MINEIIFELVNKAIREKRVKQLGRKSGLTRSRVYAIANNESSNVTAKTAEKVLEAESHPLFEDIKKHSQAA